MLTQSKDEESKQRLIHSQKDQAENVMIVDLLRNDLSIYAETGSVKTPQLLKLNLLTKFIIWSAKSQPRSKVTPIPLMY